MGRNHILGLDIGRNFLLIGLSNIMMVVFFLSGINLSIFLPLNPVIYRIGNTPNILCPRCKKQDESQPPPPSIFHFIFHCKISKITLEANLNDTKLVSKPSQWELHHNRMMASILKFYPHFRRYF